MMFAARSPRPALRGLTGILSAVTLIAGCSPMGPAADPIDQTIERHRTLESGERQAEEARTRAVEGEWRMVFNSAAALERIEETAEDWSGVPYKWGGESKQGVDCSAFVQAVYREAFHWLLPRVTEQQVRTGRTISASQLRAGDLVFFQPPRKSKHVGIYLEDRTFVHASRHYGVTQSSLDDPYWTRYYWQSRRVMSPSKLPDTLASELISHRKVDTPATQTDRSPYWTVAESRPGDDSLAASADTTVRAGW